MNSRPVFTGTPDGAKHQPPNQAAERPHKEPVETELTTAANVAALYPRFSRQNRKSVATFTDAEVPNGAGNPRRHRLVKIFTFERRKIARWAPESAGDPKYDFFP